MSPMRPYPLVRIGPAVNNHSDTLDTDDINATAAHPEVRRPAFSPTALTHSLPRPKSPRRPDSRDPKVVRSEKLNMSRRRPHYQMGFPSATSSFTPTGAYSSAAPTTPQTVPVTPPRSPAKNFVDEKPERQSIAAIREQLFPSPERTAARSPKLQGSSSSSKSLRSTATTITTTTSSSQTPYTESPMVTPKTSTQPKPYHFPERPKSTGRIRTSCLAQEPPTATRARSAGRQRPRYSQNISCFYPTADETKVADGVYSRSEFPKEYPSIQSRFSASSAACHNSIASLSSSTKNKTQAATVGAPSSPGSVQSSHVEGGCVQGGIGFAKQLREVGVTLFDIYRQECRTTHQHRGQDADFFRADSSSTRETPSRRRDATSYVLPVPTKSSELTFETKGSQRQPAYAQTTFTATTVTTPNRAFPGDANYASILDVPEPPPAAPLNDTPPRYIHLSEDPKPENGESRPTTSAAKEATSLRERRLDLLRREDTGARQPGADRLTINEMGDELATALRDDQVEQLEYKLKETKESLQRTARELSTKQEEFQRKQTEDTVEQARAVQHQEELLDRLKKMEEANRKLRYDLALQQSECSRLKSALASARVESMKQARLQASKMSDDCSHTLTPVSSPGRGVSSPGRGATDELSVKSTSDSSAVIKLKADVVGLKSRLAEAHAAQLDRTGEMTAVEISKLEGDLSFAEAELSFFLEKDRVKQESAIKEKERVSQELQRVSMEKVELAAAADAQLRTAKVKEESLLLELERARSEVLHMKTALNNEGLRMKKEVERLNVAMEKIREEADEKMKAADEKERSQEEARKLLEELQAEVRDLRTQVRESPGMGYHEEERKKLEDELARRVEISMKLENKISALDDQLANAEMVTKELRQKLQESNSKRGGATFSGIFEKGLRKVSQRNLSKEEASRDSTADGGLAEEVKVLKDKALQSERAAEEHRKKTDEEIKRRDILEVSLRTEIVELQTKLANMVNGQEASDSKGEEGRPSSEVLRVPKAHAVHSEDPEDQSASVADQTPKNPSSSKTGKLDIARLERQLRESSKRLVEANMKLKRVVKTSDDVLEENTRIRGKSSRVLSMVNSLAEQTA